MLPEIMVMDIYIPASVFLGDMDPIPNGTTAWSRIKFTALLPGTL